MYHQGATSGQMQLGIYANGTNNLPGTRLGYTNKTTASSSTGWQTINLKSAITVNAGTKIWIAWMYQSTSGARNYCSVSSSYITVTGSTWSTTTDNIPTTFGTSSSSSGYNFSIYANYEYVFPTTSNLGDMTYWDCTTWVKLPRAGINKVLTLDKNKKPVWEDNAIVRDWEGNVYHTVTLGSQTWMVENLRTTKYNTGSQITKIADTNGQNTWGTYGGPAYCWYDNDSVANSKYGALYNFYASAMPTLCPTGWRVPGDVDWETLRDYLIGAGYNYNPTSSANEIGKSLSAQYSWTSEFAIEPTAPGNDVVTNNKTGFSALPGGIRQILTGCHFKGNSCFWWSTGQPTTATGRTWFLASSYNGALTSYDALNKSAGCYIRLIKQ